MTLRTDEVVLTLGRDALRITENYEISAGIFRQPAGFAIRVGSSQSTAELLRRYPEHTPFQLTVNGRPAQSGWTDGFTTGESSGATMVTFKGRDLMAPVTKAYVLDERGFSGLTYAEFVEEILSLCFGFTPPDASKFNLEKFPYTRANGGLITSNLANRARMTGKTRVEITPPQIDYIDLQLDSGVETLFSNAVAGTSKSVFKTLKVTLGTKWYEGFAKQQLDRAGLFLWASADGKFILSAPNPNQKPSYKITRPRRGERGDGNVVAHEWERDTSDRFTKWVVYGRSGGRNHGRPKTRGEYVDREMAEIFGSPDASINTHHDKACDTDQKCAFLAQRRAAEANRNGWALNYIVSGHSTDGVFGRANWAQDTIVAVDDRELGLEGNFYVESVTMSRTPETKTRLRLMRLQDLVFGEVE